MAPAVAQLDAVDDALALEVVEALLEQGAGDPGQPAVDLVEAPAAEDQLAHDQRRPPLGDDRAGEGDRTVLRVVLHTSHCASAAPVREASATVQNLSRSGPEPVLAGRPRPGHAREVSSADLRRSR